MTNNKSSGEPDHAERGAQIVGELLKVWPAKEAPLAVHIAFCETLQRTAAPYAVGQGSSARWFGQLERGVGQRLKVLRQLEASVQKELTQAKGRVEAIVEQAPAELQRIVRQVRR